MVDRVDHVDGIQLHSIEVEEGGKEVIIFLHGFPEYSGAWHTQLTFMAEQGYHALAPDQRGYNLSSKPKGVKSYLINYIIRDITNWIRQLTADKVYLVGHDWGGAIAWELAAQYPELIHKLIILNMPHLAVMKKTLKTNPKQLLKSWYAAFFQLPMIPELVCRSFNFSFLKRAMRGTANKGTFSNQEMQSYQQAWKQPYALTAMINWYRAFKYHTITQTPIQVPTLMIWGKHDKTLNASMAQPSIQKCENGQLVMLDNATHWLHHEQPQIVNNLILDFIKSLKVES